MEPLSLDKTRTALRSSQAIPSTVQLEHVFKIYSCGDTEVRALSDLSLMIAQGEYCSIMGTSGSGKSTAMNLIGCLERPTSGRYHLDGEDVALLGDKELAQIRNLKIGFVFQQFHLLPQLNALENVMLPMSYANVALKERQERAISALQWVGLESRLYHRPNQLSGGQQQRVAIARALVNRPALILADEPTGALDTEISQQVMDLFTELNQQGITIVIVTHDFDVATQTNRIIHVQDGSVMSEKQLSK